MPAENSQGSRDLLMTAEAGQRQTRRLAALFVVLNAFLPALLYGYARYNNWEYWTQFRGEEHAANWLSTVQCVMIGLVAYANYVCSGVSARFGTGSRGRYPWAWIVFALGFVFLALDERFQIHEALRDDFFRPNDLFTDIPNLASGDVGLYFFFAVGFTFSRFLWDELRSYALAFPLFVVALLLSVAAIVLDSFDREFIRSWPNSYVWDYTVEELCELAAQLFYLLAFLRTLDGRFAELGRAPAAGQG